MKIEITLSVHVHSLVAFSCRRFTVSGRWRSSAKQADKSFAMWASLGNLDTMFEKCGISQLFVVGVSWKFEVYIGELFYFPYHRNKFIASRNRRIEHRLCRSAEENTTLRNSHFASCFFVFNNLNVEAVRRRTGIVTLVCARSTYN